MQRIIEMNWYGVHPSVDMLNLGEPYDCYEMTETPEGNLVYGEPCESVSTGGPGVTSVEWSRDVERNGLVNHTAIVRIEED